MCMRPFYCYNFTLSCYGGSWRCNLFIPSLELMLWSLLLTYYFPMALTFVFWTRQAIPGESPSNLKTRRKVGPSIVHLSNGRQKWLFKVCFDVYVITLEVNWTILWSTILNQIFSIFAPIVLEFWLRRQWWLLFWLSKALSYTWCSFDSW